MSVKKSVGRITAYAAAVSAGYTGTYRQFCEDQANFAKNAQQVASDRKAAEQVKTDVERIKRETENITSDALSEVETAKNTAVQEIGNTAADKVSDVNAAGEAQVGAIQDEGAAQIGNVRAAGSAAVEDVYAAAEMKKTEISDIGTVLVGEQTLTVPQKARVKSNLDAADGIIETAAGEVIVLDDASDQHFRGLTVYGKSTQDGTPSPDAPVPIVSAFEDGGGVAVTGKNLIPGAGRAYNGLTATNNADGSVTVSGSVAADGSVLMYLFLSAAASNYTKIWYNPTSPLKVTLYKDGAVYTDTFTTRYKTRDGGSVYTPVSGAYFDAVYIQKTLTAGDTSLCGTYRIQVEVGSAATDYEPYTGQTLSIATPDGLCGIPVTSGGNYTDANGQMWICDEVDFGRGVYIKRLEKYMYNGGDNEAWRKQNSTTPYVFAETNVSTGILKPATNNIKALLLCDKYPVGYHGNVYTDTVYNVVTVSSATGNIYIKPTAFSGTTQDEFKAWLADNPFTVVYVLAEPVETPLTESELAAYRALHTNRPNTTIYADDNAGLSVEYAADTKKYIDKKFTELRDAVLSMGGNV